MGILFPCLSMSLRSRHHYQDQILQCFNVYLVTSSTEHERRQSLELASQIVVIQILI